MRTREQIIERLQYDVDTVEDAIKKHRAVIQHLVDDAEALREVIAMLKSDAKQ